MARIVRPLRGRLQVWLPFRQSGRGNFILLKQLCGERTQPKYNRALGCFEVARDHLPVLIERLPGMLGMPVELVLHGSTQTKCAEKCWTAKPETYWDCECSCAGRFHGSVTGPPKQFGAGFGVETTYTTNVMTLHP